MSVKDLMRRTDARIYRSRIVRAVGNFGVVDGVEGAFFEKPREVDLPGGGVMSIGISFECQYREEFAGLAAEQLVEIDERRFRFLRELLPGGDESGKTVIELGQLR
jgi:hypothetical protein